MCNSYNDSEKKSAQGNSCAAAAVQKYLTISDWFRGLPGQKISRNKTKLKNYLLCLIC
jgi:hypothetical protein